MMKPISFILSSSPIDEIIRLANYKVKHIWNISESRSFNEMNYLPQQYCQLSKHIYTTIVPKIRDRTDKLLIISHCSELNRFHSLLDEICRHDFIEIPRSSRKHAQVYLEKQIEDHISNDSSLKSVSINQLKQEVKDRRNLIKYLKEVHLKNQMKYVDVLSLVHVILDRDAASFQQIKNEIDKKISRSSLEGKTKIDKPSILILGEFWCEEIIKILEKMDELFEIKKDTFENGLGFVYQELKETSIEDLKSYINFVVLNTIKGKFNPSSLDFDVDEISNVVEQNSTEGIIILSYKFCDVYTFLAPLIKQIPNFDLPILEIELESEGLGFEQVKTRLEAFKECLIDRREN
ncbi:MAG: 2-hydroxyacyl-CoA dehydratase [Candidatus Heimdallarchaeota archaeon]|nr:2-hydroxyacyl-CoA dehydratase [Candidatus Heimdallarchaeota archaeon]